MRTIRAAVCGLLLTTFALGCGGGEGDGYGTSKKGKDVEVDKEPDAPHGGHVVHLEPHHAVHLELTFDEEKRTATFYVIAEKDGKWEDHDLADDALHFHYEPEGATDEVEVEFTAVREGDATTTNVFTAAELPEDIKDEEDVVGHIHLDLDGKEHVGDVSHDGAPHVH